MASAFFAQHGEHMHRALAHAVQTTLSERPEDPVTRIGQLLLANAPSKDAAIEFCNRNGLAYEVIEPKVMRRQIKSYGDNFRYWGRVVNHHTKSDPRVMHGIDASIKDQAILTNADKLSPETANSSVFPARQPELAADPRGAGAATQYGREEWGGKGVPKPPSAALGGAKKNPPTE